MRWLILGAVVAAFGTPSFAERQISPRDFEAMVEGKTLTFNRDGKPFGAEQYLSDRRVIWSFADGNCQRGIWFESVRGDICFVYDEDPEPQCWSFLETDEGGFHARQAGADPDSDLVMREMLDKDLICELPDLSV